MCRLVTWFDNVLNITADHNGVHDSTSGSEDTVNGTRSDDVSHDVLNAKHQCDEELLCKKYQIHHGCKVVSITSMYNVI